MSAGSRSRALGVLLPGFVGTELPDWLAARLRAGLAGVCLFGENIVDPTQTRALTDAIRAANPDAVIAIDEEGGDVTRLHAATGSPYPGNAILGRLDDLAVTARVGESVARELAAVGVNLNFAPDVDVNSNPDNPVIGVRSFGDDPDTVAAHAAAWIVAHEAAGVAVSAKHFPGHGDTAQDSHLALPVVDVPLATLEQRELPPFAASIDAGARTVMSSHIVLPQLDELPATFSSPLLDGLLRTGLGFAGAVVSDALDMAGASAETGIPIAAVRAIAGGCDLLCIGTRNTDEQIGEIVAALDAAVDGTPVSGSAHALSAARLDEAADRVSALAASLRATVPAGEPGASVPVFDPSVIAEAFELRPGIALPEISGPDAVPVIALETAANIAVGASPWGLAAAGVDVVQVREGDALPGSGPWLITGKANHRHAWVREIVDAARRAHPDTVVVDLGWPSPDRAYADVATFGASRLAAQALLSLLPSAGEHADDAAATTPEDGR